MRCHNANVSYLHSTSWGKKLLFGRVVHAVVERWSLLSPAALYALYGQSRVFELSIISHTHPIIPPVGMIRFQPLPGPLMNLILEESLQLRQISSAIFVLSKASNIGKLIPTTAFNWYFIKTMKSESRYLNNFTYCISKDNNYTKNIVAIYIDLVNHELLQPTYVRTNKGP